MALQANPVPRVFRYKALELPDPAPNLTPERVVTQMLAMQYSELNGATVSGPTQVGGRLVYEIETGFKPKG